MFDSYEMLSKPTFGMCLWCFCLVMSIMTVTWNANYHYSINKPISAIKGWRTGFLLLAFLLLALTYWIDGDTYDYMDMARTHDVDFIFDDNHKMEKGHQLLCSIVNGDWMGFRFLCWGSAMLLFVLTAKRFNINIQHALFCLFILWFHIFCYGRSTLAVSLYIYGLSFLLKPIKVKFLGYVLGIALICMCVYFHRSAILLVAITPSIFIFIFKKRASWFYLLIVFSFILIAIILNVNLIYKSKNLDEGTMLKLENYSMSGSTALSILSQIRSTLYDLVKYGVVAILTYVIVKCRKDKIPRFVMMLYALTITIVAVALGFYFSGDAQYTLFFRTLNFIMVPSSLLLAYFHQNGLVSQKLFHSIIGFGAFMCFFRVFYSVYYA